MMKNPMIFFEKCRQTALVWGVGMCVLSGCHKHYHIEESVLPEEQLVETTLSLSTEELAFEASGGWKEFTVSCNAGWLLASGGGWCQPGVTAGAGSMQVKVAVERYEGLEDRNTLLVVKAGNLTKTLAVTQKAVGALTVTKNKFNVPQEGQEITVEIKGNMVYEAIIPKEFQEWISKTAGAAENGKLRFTIAANEDTETREGYIFIESGGLRETVYIYQAQHDCLIFPKDTYELTAAAQELNTELRTNVDYEIVIPDSVKGWVSCPPESRALRVDRLRLDIAENKTADERRAVVIVKDQNSELADTLHIRQAMKEPETEKPDPETPFLTLEPQEFEMEATGGSVNVTINTNVEYDVEIPAKTQAWVHVEKGENGVLLLTVDVNEGTEARKAAVTVKAKNAELRATLTIRQAAKEKDPEISEGVFPKTEYILEESSASESVEFTVPVDWEAAVAYEGDESGWLSISSENGKAGKAEITVSVIENTEATERKAYIDIAYGEKSQRITVTQRGKEEAPYLTVEQKEVTVEAEGGESVIAISTNMEYDVTIPEEAKEWIEIANTTNKEIRLQISANNSNDAREATVNVKAQKSELSATLLVRQAAKEKQEPKPEGDLTDNFAPRFAQVLQKKGFIRDASAITEEEINKITELNLSSQGLTSLRGIEYFTELTDLNCESNQLTILDVSKNTELTSLSCGDNQLTTLDVSKNTELTKLYCGGNPLTTLDVSGCTALADLDCTHNQLTTLDVSKNTALTSLGCQINQLTTLDVSKNTKLTALMCDENQLTTLDVSKNTALTWLQCDENQLTTLDVSGCTALSWFTCSRNQLTTLNVNNNTVLAILDCYENQISTLDISNNTELTHLRCNQNKLTTLDVSKSTELTSLECYGNPGDGETSFPLKTWTPGESPTTLEISDLSWTYNGKTITITFQ